MLALIHTFMVNKIVLHVVLLESFFPDYKDFISFLRGLIYYLTVLVQCCRFSYFCSPFRYIILLWFIEVGCGDASGFVSKLSSSVLCETLVLPSSA